MLVCPSTSQPCVAASASVSCMLRKKKDEVVSPTTPPPLPLLSSTTGRRRARAKGAALAGHGPQGAGGRGVAAPRGPPGGFGNGALFCVSIGLDTIWRGVGWAVSHQTHVRAWSVDRIHPTHPPRNPTPTTAKTQTKQIRLLLAAGLEPSSRDEDGRTAAEAALLSGHLKAFELLASRAAAAIVPPPPLHHPQGAGKEGGGGSAAGQQGTDEGGEVAGADKTPLHAAAECGSVAAVLR